MPESSRGTISPSRARTSTSGRLQVKRPSLLLGTGHERCLSVRHGASRATDTAQYRKDAVTVNGITLIFGRRSVASSTSFSPLKNRSTAICSRASAGRSRLALERATIPQVRWPSRSPTSADGRPFCPAAGGPHLSPEEVRGPFRRTRLSAGVDGPSAYRSHRCRSLAWPREVSSGLHFRQYCGRDQITFRHRA